MVGRHVPHDEVHVRKKTDVTPAQVTGISFCSQMQGMVLVDEHGRALRRPMSYMDQRASAEFKACQTHGPCVSGVNIGMLLRSLRATHAASTSVKDPLWKYKWVQAHEPEIFQEAHKWLDVKESLIARATGEFVMTRDSAYSTFLYDTRPGREGWNEGLCRMYGVETRHLAKIIECTDVAGLLTEQAARELGLCPRHKGLRRRRRRDAHRRGCGLHRRRQHAYLFRHVRLGRNGDGPSGGRSRVDDRGHCRRGKGKIQLFRRNGDGRQVLRMGQGSSGARRGQYLSVQDRRGREPGKRLREPV